MINWLECQGEALDMVTIKWIWVGKGQPSGKLKSFVPKFLTLSHMNAVGYFIT